MTRKHGHGPVTGGRKRGVWAESRRIRSRRSSSSWLILAAIALLIAVMLIGFDQAGARTNACPPPPTRAKLASLPTEYPRFYRQLRWSFGRSWRDAAVVSWKEGSWHWWARNGQYLGTFQLGSAERAAHGHGNTLAAQARAAASLWRDRGWHPWECQP